MAAGQKPKFFATGNRATGFIAFGNVATGVIAFGNVTRGFIAVGNVAIGVIAIGNVAIGVFSLGASAASGLVAYGLATAFPIVQGASATGVEEAIPVITGILSSLVLLGVSFILRGKKPGSTEEAPGPIIELAMLRERRLHDGWVRARFAGREGGRVRLHIEGTEHLLPLEGSAERLVAGQPPAAGTDCFARLTASERPAADPHVGYRQEVDREVVLACAGLVEVPPRPPIWADKDHLLYYLAFGWRSAGVTGIAWTLYVLGRAIF